MIIHWEFFNMPKTFKNKAITMIQNLKATFFAKKFD